jgi:putative flippase GtrA
MRPSEDLVPIGRSLPGFLVAGFVGFCLDAGLMTALVSLFGWSPIASRIISFPVALACTWLLNRRWSFAGRGLESSSLEYLTYVGIQIIGAATNVGVFIGCLRRWPSLAVFPVIPLAIGAAFALAFNYSALRWFLYRRRRRGGR